jgi:hypothetical protein
VAELGAWIDGCADVDRRDDRLVGGADRAARYDDDAAAGEQSGVRDRAGGGGEDGLAGGAGQVDAAVAG